MKRVLAATLLFSTAAMGAEIIMGRGDEGSLRSAIVLLRMTEQIDDTGVTSQQLRDLGFDDQADQMDQAQQAAGAVHDLPGEPTGQEIVSLLQQHRVIRWDGPSCGTVVQTATKATQLCQLIGANMRTMRYSPKVNSFSCTKVQGVIVWGAQRCDR